MAILNDKLSYEYVRGLVEGKGSFSFCSIGWKGEKNRRKLPAFILSMSKQDKELMEKVKNTLGLRNKVYEYAPRKAKDSYNRQGMCILIIRDVGQLKNKIVPLFYKKLRGNKGKQFELWLEKIGNDPNVPDSYKFIYRLYKSGFYEKDNWLTKQYDDNMAISQIKVSQQTLFCDR